MVKPTLEQGRWLLPEDAKAIVISQKVLADETDITVGDTITLEIDDKQSPWIVVGIAQVLGGPPDQIQVYVNYPYFARLTNNVGRACYLQIKLAPDSGLRMETLAAQLNERLEKAKVLTLRRPYHRHAAPLHRRLFRYCRLSAAQYGCVDRVGGALGADGYDEYERAGAHP